MPDQPERALDPHTTASINSLGELLAAQGRQYRDAPAISDISGSVMTYAELAEQAVETRRALRTAGIGPRDRVALVLPDGPDAAVAFLTVAAAATTAPLNPNYRAAELAFYLEDLGARAVIVPAGAAGEAAAVARERGIMTMELTPRGHAPGAFNLRAPATAAGADGDPSAGDIALVLHTSGTTARPKLVLLTHTNLCVSGRNIADSLALGPSDRCLNVMPLFHVHGLIGALLSTISSGGTIVCTPGFNAPKLLQWLGDARASWYTAVPTMHQAIAERAATRPDLPVRTTLRLIRSCSSALAPSLFAELERLFAVPVLEAYGMTEAAHQIASNPLPPRARKAGSTGLAAGPDVAVITDDGTPLPRGVVGELAIRGTNVTAGYADPKANDAAFVRGWFRTGDQGYQDDDGYIFLTGRIKELINRGGEKLAPREIDEALLAHPAVAQAVTFGIPDARLGEAVAAAVVLRAGASVSERELREFVAGRLAFFKVPSRIAFVPDIPKGPTGKLQRRGLGERLGLDSRAPAPAPEVDSLDAPVERVTEIAAALLGLERISADVSFIEAGGDSLLAAQLVSRLRDVFGVEVSLIDVFDAPTLAAIAGIVAEQILDDIENVAGQTAG